MITFEWRVNVGGSKHSAIAGPFRERAMPKLIPLSPSVYNAMAATTLHAIARSSEQRAAAGRANVTVSCVPLGAPKTTTAYPEGQCDDPSEAGNSFTLNGSSWPDVGMGRNNHRLVAAMWTFRQVPGMGQPNCSMAHFVTYARLDNLLYNGQCWAPPPGIFEEDVKKRLEELAEETYQSRCVHCSLVAVKTVDGQSLATFQ